MKSVYLRELFCISSSGANLKDVIDNYDSGKRPLQAYHFNRAPNFGPISAGLIDQSILGIDQTIEDCPSSPRIIAGLRNLLEQISRSESAEEPFDAIVIARGRLKSLNLLAIEDELLSVRSFDSLQSWIEAECARLGIRFSGSKNISFVDGTCSSGLQILNMAWKRIRRGIWRRALVIAFDPFAIAGYSRLDALGVISRAPLAESPKVFHAARDGFVKSECYVAGVLDEMSGLQPGEHPLRIVSSSVTCDANSLAAIQSDGDGLKECIMRTMQMAMPAFPNITSLNELMGTKIGLIKAHGTGTMLNDRIESAVIRDIFQEMADHIPTVTFKSQFGHTTNASGLFELIIAKHCLQTRVVKAVPLSHPTAEECKIFVPNRDMALGEKSCALLLSIGFGGINSSLLLERAPAI